ncbi:Cys-rich protein [Leptospira fletcheri]|uniref:Cys-rich protein n=1 Tax=Leptospira fletcheri TaxID=2484981 RepID=A0A4V3JD95_9LEPT|nr:Cys-rich protein [Leptospira fletcheri]TGK09029.1 Cys-rich protein [Leptospira fletcheri]
MISTRLFRYLPILLLGAVVGVFIAIKYAKLPGTSGTGEWEGKEICLEYCDSLTKCTKEAVPLATEDQLYKMENSCLRGCRKHFDKMQVCLVPEKMNSCTHLTSCLFQEMKKYY